MLNAIILYISSSLLIFFGIHMGLSAGSVTMRNKKLKWLLFSFIWPFVFLLCCLEWLRDAINDIYSKIYWWLNYKNIK